MKTAILAVCVLVIVFAQQVNGQCKAESHSQKMHLKNWALSRCLGQVASDEKTKKDAYATASAYLESGQQPVEVYEALTTVVNKYADRKYSGSISSDFTTKKCSDLFNSKELDDLARKFSKRK